VILYSMV